MSLPDQRASGRSAPPLDLAPIVLLADNERILLEVVREALMDEQFRVLTATDGQDALALAETTVPDVLLTDVNMPRLDGFGLIRAVRRLYPEVPVIVMTGSPSYGERPVKDVAAEHGAVATIMKPFDLAALQQIVRNAMPLLSAGALHQGALSKEDRAA